MPKTLTQDDRVKTATADACAAAGSGPAGLAKDEAGKRLAASVPDEPAEHTVSPLRKLIGYFLGPIPFMIEAAAVLSALIGHREDLAIILVLLLLNAAGGFWQEHKAGNAIALVKSRLALQARVLRDVAWSAVAAREPVYGDVVRARLGDIVPAELKITAATTSRPTSRP